jgi:hypothetical protein
VLADLADAGEAVLLEKPDRRADEEAALRPRLETGHRRLLSTLFGTVRVTGAPGAARVWATSTRQQLGWPPDGKIAEHNGGTTRGPCAAARWRSVAVAGSLAGLPARYRHARSG